MHLCSLTSYNRPFVRQDVVTDNLRRRSLKIADGGWASRKVTKRQSTRDSDVEHRSVPARLIELCQDQCGRIDAREPARGFDRLVLITGCRQRQVAVHGVSIANQRTQIFEHGVIVRADTGSIDQHDIGIMGGIKSRYEVTARVNKTQRGVIDRAQALSCSIAPARWVSVVMSETARPRLETLDANLVIAVVFPTPVGPTKDAMTRPTSGIVALVRTNLRMTLSKCCSCISLGVRLGKVTIWSMSDSSIPIRRKCARNPCGGNMAGGEVVYGCSRTE